MNRLKMLFQKGRNYARAKHAQHRPCNDPVAGGRSTTTFRDIVAHISNNLTARIRWVARVLIDGKAHFFSPSINYTKLDGNANEPCTAVHNGLQGQLRMITA